MDIDNQTFTQFKNIIHEFSGICLSDEKKALMQARLAKRIRSLNLGGYREYLEYVNSGQNKEELIQLLDVISTNVTHFFREPDHFDFVRNQFEQAIDSGQRRFRIWSCASSTGEEPYTLAIVLQNVLDSRRTDIDFKILATDISTRVLKTAIDGLYSAERVKTVPDSFLKQYMHALNTPSGRMYEVSPALRKRVSFRRLNLSQPPFPMKGPLDLVLCRNVMIYFNNQTRSALVDDIQRLLKPNGHLLIGHAESLNGIQNKLKVVRPSIYQKAGALSRVGV